MNIPLSSIQRDASIQCRAEIDLGVVNDYAERMSAGDKFPPVELFGVAGKCWPGDGWHRIMAAESIGAKSIVAHLRKGGRVDALKHALSANSLHGHRRSNADKRRCVEIALAEFPNDSSRKIAKLCGVSDPFVNSLRPEALQTVSNATRLTSDGRQYPARRSAPEEQEHREEREPRPTEERRELGPPEEGIGFAEMAILDLEQIRPEDTQRKAAWELVRRWLDEHQ